MKTASYFLVLVLVFLGGCVSRRDVPETPAVVENTPVEPPVSAPSQKPDAEPTKVPPVVEPLPPPLPQRVVNSIGMKLVLIPAGTFRMGSPRDEKGRGADEEAHEAEISRPFYLGICETTQE